MWQLNFCLDRMLKIDYLKRLYIFCRSKIIIVLLSIEVRKELLYMLKVKSRAGESVQQMIRRFKKLCEKEGLIRDMKRNAYYEKPSEKNRRRMRKAQRSSNY